jgi:hypothetical protein
VRAAAAWEDSPNLIGLTSGAAVVRLSDQTRYALSMLKRVQMMQGAADSDADAAKPLQVGCVFFYGRRVSTV